ncbi:MAG: ATP-binding cassette domain-containing protein [Bacteroidetes bacterium]|nr:ATP-binding cassette domain-containing protein [Bacteroidota bacterium]MBU2585531.1 ATP-binding cassette domain-containing protein [Bacteroidota bacterium]
MLSFENIYFDYEGHSILNGINFVMDSGELLYMIGASGSGKTTVLKLIYMDLLPKSGIVAVGEFNSQFMKEKYVPMLRRKLGIIFQDFRLLNDRTIEENLSFVLHSVTAPKKEIKRKIFNALSLVGLSHRRNSYPYQLSGGEQQRVVIARAIINDPILILADEPTGNLDPDTSAQIMEILKDINARGTAVLIATHNYEIVKNNPARTLKLQEEKLYTVSLVTS